MSDAADLLPSNATHLERTAGALAFDMATVDVPIRALVDPFACPPAFLPHLAWARSVDVWDPDWPEATKRAVIDAAPDVHRFKGTPFAIRRALQALGLTVRFTEWFELSPRGVPGTFRVDVSVDAAAADGTTLLGDGTELNAFSPAVTRAAHEQIMATKPASRTFELRMGMDVPGDMFAALYAGADLSWTVVPLEFDGLETRADIFAASASGAALDWTIEPQSAA